MSTISLKVNGQLHRVETDPSTPLLFVLSDELGLRGPKFGCGMAQCGSCTVILRGQAVRSCVMPVSSVGRRRNHNAGGARHSRETASHSADLHRRRGGAMRILPERRDPEREGRTR